jgi:hypothetical protein
VSLSGSHIRYRRDRPIELKKAMKKTALVVLSIVVFCNAAIAADAIVRDGTTAQMDQPNSSQASPPQADTSAPNCAPIGLTARGELVFPWECRAIIERERGPVSLDILAPANDLSSNMAKDPVQPPAGSSVAKSVAVDAPAKNQPTPPNADVERAATVPDAASSPPQPAATIAPPDRKPQAKRTAGRARTDGKGAPALVPPARGGPSVNPAVPR